MASDSKRILRLFDEARDALIVLSDEAQATGEHGILRKCRDMIEKLDDMRYEFFNDYNDRKDFLT